MGRLTGHSGIVVGAGQDRGSTTGNGRAAALVFAQAGAKVLCVDRDAESAAQTVALIREDGGVAEAHVADWTVDENCAAYARACVDLWGRIDFLQNNVGVAVGDSSPDLVTADTVRRIYETNALGCLLSCRAVLPTMVADGGGSIVNVSSIAATAYTPQLAYKMSKAAQNALTQTLALTYAEAGVRVNSVALGFLDTPVAMNALTAMTGLDEDVVRAARGAAVPLRHRMGTAWDCARTSLFLHSADADFVTGAVLPVDGGHTALIGGNLVNYAELKAESDQH